MRMSDMTSKVLHFDLTGKLLIRIHCNGCVSKVDTFVELPIEKLRECSSLSCPICGKTFRKMGQPNRLNDLASAIDFLSTNNDDYRVELALPVTD